MADKLQVDPLSLLLIERDGVKMGYRLDLLKESIPPHFKTFVICSRCEGLMRGACGIGEPQQFMCVSCAGDDTWIALTANRDVIINLVILCPLTSRGCGWEGSISSADSHIECCGHFNTECIQGCGAILRRMDMEKHLNEECELREIKCEYCGELIKVSETSPHLLITCVSLPVECENGCGAEIERCQMLTHTMDVCANALVECEYSKCGCAAVVERKNIKSHNDDNRFFHVELLMQAGFTRLNEELDRVSQENRILKQELGCVVEEKLVHQRTIIALKDTGASLVHDLNALKRNKEKEYHNFQIYRNELMRDTIGPATIRVDKLEEKSEEIATQLDTKAQINSVGSLSRRCEDLDYLSLFRFKKRFVLTKISEPGIKTISESWDETKNYPANIIKLFREFNKNGLFQITGVFGVRVLCNVTIRVCVVLMNQTQGVIQRTHKFTTVTNREEMGSVRDIREAGKANKYQNTLKLADIPIEEILSRDVCVKNSVCIQIYFDCDLAI